MITEAERVRHMLFLVLDEINDLRNINRYNYGDILSAMRYIDKAIDSVDRLVARCDRTH